MYRSKSLNILIIDDCPEFIKSLSKLVIDTVGKEINKINSAFNVYDGLALARDNQFHYIFLDIKMSSIENIQTAKSVCDKTNYTPEIVAVSFHDEAIFKNQAIRAGANHYLVKDEIDHSALSLLFN